ncbi:hypothetical protein J3U31_09605 [Gilliamella sp. B3486]|uniref:hypothetical protein n=1 Tax=unclassified Gilliamella TaxID=2685620 RepID=UPI00226A1BFF|nr:MULTISPECIES: hypothetical protein [unclassified Gilliamella]MCX8597717.1 hypothetical protein [Gilliamella sp. B3493]MCX8599864.1 hypothetical protein [Gilliamella sp. B3486]MCX8705853.1 hypothetical protein [Gilliamella sp. B3127]
MQKVSFFKLPLTGCLVYFLFSIFLNISFLYWQQNASIPNNLFWYLLFDSNFLFRFIFEKSFIEALWVFGLLAIFFYSFRIHIVNKANVTLLIILMLIYSIVASFIAINTDVKPQNYYLYSILYSLAFAIIRYSLEALLLYYLIDFSRVYFVKDQSEFIWTKKNSSKIHFILFSIFSCFILIKGFILLFQPLLDKFYVSNFLIAIYLSALLFGLVLSKRCFHIFSNKVLYVKLFKSVSISNILILAVVYITFTIINNNPTKYYIDSFVTIFNHINKLFLILLVILLICLILNKITKYYFGMTNFKKSQNESN